MRRGRRPGHSRVRPLPGSPGLRRLGSEPGTVSRTQQGRHTLEPLSMKAAPRPQSPTGRLPVRGSRGPPLGPPQVSKEAQRLLWSLLLPSPVGVAIMPSRARPSLRLVPSHTAPCSQAPYKTSRPRRDRNGHSQLHYIFHHSRHLPGSSPSGLEARSPQRAGAGAARGTSFLVLLRRRCPGARARERATENESLAGSPGPETRDECAGATGTGARPETPAPVLPLPPGGVGGEREGLGPSKNEKVRGW